MMAAFAIVAMVSFFAFMRWHLSREVILKRVTYTVGRYRWQAYEKTVIRR